MAIKNWTSATKVHKLTAINLSVRFFVCWTGHILWRLVPQHYQNMKFWFLIDAQRVEDQKRRERNRKRTKIRPKSIEIEFWCLFGCMVVIEALVRLSGGVFASLNDLCSQAAPVYSLNTNLMHKSTLTRRAKNRKLSQGNQKLELMSYSEMFAKNKKTQTIGRLKRGEAKKIHEMSGNYLWACIVRSLRCCVTCGANESDTSKCQ